MQSLARVTALRELEPAAVCRLGDSSCVDMANDDASRRSDTWVVILIAARLTRSARLLALIGVMSVAVSVAPQIARAERVKATLTFIDGNGQKRPLRRATVEIWRKHGFVPVWHNDFTVTTDELGKIDFAVPSSEWLGPGAVYGLRVYAINPAAIVRFLDRPQDAMYAQPGYAL